MTNSEINTSSVNDSPRSSERNAKEVLLGRGGHVLGVGPLHPRGRGVSVTNLGQDLRNRNEVPERSLFKEELEAWNRLVKRDGKRKAVPWPSSLKPSTCDWQK